MENKKKIRNSNVELVRIISMFFIVAGHFISQSGSVAYRLAGQYSSDIKTIPNFLIALLLVIWFIDLKSRHNQLINKAAEFVFTMLLIICGIVEFFRKQVIELQIIKCELYN